MLRYDLGKRGLDILGFTRQLWSEHHDSVTDADGARKLAVRYLMKIREAGRNRTQTFQVAGDNYCFDDIPTAWPSNDNILQMTSPLRINRDFSLCRCV